MIWSPLKQTISCRRSPPRWVPFESIHPSTSWDPIITISISSLAFAENFGKQQQSLIYARALKAHALQGSLTFGRLLHARIMIVGDFSPSDLLINNALINMYGKCGCLEDAKKVLCHMTFRDTVSWNTLIAAHVSNGKLKDVIACFRQMQEDGVQPDNVTCISLLSSCTNQDALVEGMEIHDLVLKKGFDLDLNAQNAIICMYGKCGCSDAAGTVFDKTSQDDIVAWNAMISAFSYNGFERQAYQCFNQMNQKAVIPNRITYISILSLCVNKSALSSCQWVHAVVMSIAMHQDVVMGTAVINMYGKIGNVEQAKNTFDDLSERNVISWNSMIAVYTQDGLCKQAQKLFYQMQQESVTSSKITFVNILESCSSSSASTEGKRLHVFIHSNGFDADVVVTNALLNMYGKCCRLAVAKEIFETMTERNDISWNTLITCYAQNQQGAEASLLFNQMLHEGISPNKVTFIALIDACAVQADLRRGSCVHAQIVASSSTLDNIMGNALLNFYCKCSQMVIAQEMFEELIERDVVAWSAIIAGFSLQGEHREVLFLFNHMCQGNVIPNKVTYVSVIAALAGQSAQVDGNRIHAIIISQGLELDLVIANSLINLHGKCGNITDAQTIFDIMPEKDIFSWSAMIAAYAQHGESDIALKLFCQMRKKGIAPNKITFISIISACGHTGKIEEGYYWFAFMERRFGVTPMMDHYNCMIDLLGRAGRLDEAERLVLGMPSSELTVVPLMALLSSCKYQNDVERAEHFAEHAFALFPDNPEPYIMLANIYSTVGRRQEAGKLFTIMKGKNLEVEIDL